MTLTYRQAGVDIEAGDRAVELMKRHVATTLRPEVLGNLGGFGGLFALDTTRYRQPVLVAGSDGVGTKLKLAIELDQHDTIGIDAVAMCVNDILVHGAEPLFFLDYLAVGKLDPERAAAIVAGVAEGCRQAGCALIGGETAEMPGLYAPADYDLAGFAVGVVEREQLLDGARVSEGDGLLGLPSSGLHSNGFSLVRRVVEQAGWRLDHVPPGWACSLGQELLIPTRIYIPAVLPLLQQGLPIHAMAHITGGGLVGNLPRVLPDGLGIKLWHGSWPQPPVFALLQQQGDIPQDDMESTFNLGLGMVLIVAAGQEIEVQQALAGLGQESFLVGRVERGAKVVEWVARGD